MYYGEIKKCDIANGPGVRVSLFVSGCTHHCKGCFNEETWSFEYGKPFTEETEEQILKLLEPSYISGLTVLGGEPMEYMNQEVLFPFLKKVKERFPEKSIWCFTGYVYEKDILHRMIPKWKYTKKMLEQIDYLVDGPFVMEKKNISLKFRGSSGRTVEFCALAVPESHNLLKTSSNFSKTNYEFASIAKDSAKNKKLSYICGLGTRIECERGGEHSTHSDRVTNIG